MAIPVYLLAAKTYDFVGEELYYEGPPARGDLATNILLGATILWIVRSLVLVVALVLLQRNTLSVSFIAHSAGLYAWVLEASP